MPSPFPVSFDLTDRLILNRTMARLTWAHGVDRAASILAGQDVETNADIANWLALGARAERRKQKNGEMT